MKKDYSSSVLLGLLLWYENQPSAAIDQFKKINTCLVDHHGLGDIRNYFLPALYFPSLTQILIKADFPVENIIDHFKNSHLPWLNDTDTCIYVAQKKPEILHQLLNYFPVDDLYFILDDTKNLEIILDYFPTSLSNLLKAEIETNHSSLEDNLFNYFDKIITVLSHHQNLDKNFNPDVFYDYGFEPDEVLALQEKYQELTKILPTPTISNKL